MAAELRDSYQRKGSFPPFIDTTVPNLAARNALLVDDVLYPELSGIAYGGMIVSVLDNELTYKLSADKTTWTELGSGVVSPVDSFPTHIIYGGGITADVENNFSFSVEPTGWQIDFLESSFTSIDFSVDQLDDDSLVRLDRPLLTKEDDPDNPGTLIILKGVESTNPHPPDYNPALFITLDLIKITGEAASVVYPNVYGLTSSDNRSYQSAIYIRNTLTDLLARPIPSAELTRTYLDDNNPISWKLVFDEPSQLYKIVPLFDTSILPIIQVDYTDVTKLDILSGRNIFFINNVEDEDDINAIYEFINHSNNLRGSIHNVGNRLNEYPFTEYLPDFDFYETNDPAFYRTDGTMNSWVGGTGIAIAANRFIRQVPKQGSSITYYIFTDETDSIWNTHIIEYNIITKAYNTYTQTNFQSAYDESQSGLWVSNELYIPCGSATADKILVYNSSTHTFTTSTVSNPQSNPIYWQFFAHSDGTNVWFVAGRGGLPETDRRCVTKINISTKVYTWMRSIANTYQNFFSTATHMYMIRRPGAIYTNELTRYGYTDNSWNENFSIIGSTVQIQMAERQAIPVVSGKACLFYRDGVDLQMAVIANLDAVSFGGETSTVTTIASGHYNFYSIYDTTNTYVYQVIDNGTIIRITLASAAVTTYTGVIPIDGEMTTLDDSSYQGFVNPNNGYLYINSTNSTKYLTYIVDTATMTFVKSISTRNLSLLDAQAYGNKTATIFSGNQPTILEGLNWKADINIVSSGPYFNESVEALPKANDTSFYVNLYDNLLEKFSGLFVDGSAYVPLAGTTAMNGVFGMSNTSILDSATTDGVLNIGTTNIGIGTINIGATGTTIMMGETNRILLYGHILPDTQLITIGHTGFGGMGIKMEYGSFSNSISAGGFSVGDTNTNKHVRFHTDSQWILTDQGTGATAEYSIHQPTGIKYGYGGTFTTDVIFTHPTTNRTITFKDGSGTVAFTSDITGTSSPLTTKGDLWVYSTTNARQPVGTNGYALLADSTQTTGLIYKDLSTLYIPLSGTTSGHPITGNLEVGVTSLYYSTTFDYEVTGLDTFVKIDNNLNEVHLGVRDNDSPGSEAQVIVATNSGNYSVNLLTPTYSLFMDDTNGWVFTNRGSNTFQTTITNDYVGVSQPAANHSVAITDQFLLFSRNGFTISVLPLVSPSAPTANRAQYLPDKDGTFAMLSDVNALQFKSSDPSGGDITNNTFSMYKNTTSNVVKLWINDGGTYKSVTLT